MVWALFVYELAAPAMGPRAFWSGVLASPLIGVVVGLTFGRLRWQSRVGRALASLLGLYTAAFLFGIAIGIADLATGTGRNPVETVLQVGLAMVWGVTATGYVLFLWPLAYLNFWLLWNERYVSLPPRETVEALHRGTPYSAAILASPALAENAEWWAAGSRERLPWAGTWRGKTGIAEFFTVLNREMDYERFEAEDIFAARNTVIAIVSAAGRSIRTGRRFESHIVREYTFRSGKIIRVRNFYDTADYERSLGD